MVLKLTNFFLKGICREDKLLELLLNLFASIPFTDHNIHVHCDLTNQQLYLLINLSLILCYPLLYLLPDVFCMFGQGLFKRLASLTFSLNFQNKVLDRRVQTVEDFVAVVSFNRVTTDHCLTSLLYLIKAKSKRGGWLVEVFYFRFYILVERFELLIQSAMRGFQIFYVCYYWGYVNLQLRSWLLQTFEFLHQFMHVGGNLLDLFFNLSYSWIVSLRCLFSFNFWAHCSHLCFQNFYFIIWVPDFLLLCPCKSAEIIGDPEYDS